MLRGDDRFILSHWGNGPGEKYEGWGVYPELSRLKRGEFQQWHVMAAPGHPILERAIAQVNQPVMLPAASAPLPEMTRPAARISAPPDDRQEA